MAVLIRAARVVAAAVVAAVAEAAAAGDAEAVVVVDSALSGLPALGVGLGFRAPFRSQLFLQQQEVDFLEITVEHYLDASLEKQRELDLLREHFTLIPHAINLSLGSADGLDENYLSKLARLINRLNPPWWSEHISFTRVGDVDIGHLSPLPFSDEAIRTLEQNIERVRERIHAPLILENITYMLNVPGGRMDEAEFLREVTKRTGCGLLLDVTNLYINSVNHKYDVESFLDRIPLDRVVQLHFVGGLRHGAVLIDSHSEATPAPVWSLMETVIARAPVKAVVLERDENFPPFAQLLDELARARAIGRRHERWA